MANDEDEANNSIITVLASAPKEEEEPLILLQSKHPFFQPFWSALMREQEALKIAGLPRLLRSVHLLPLPRYLGRKVVESAALPPPRRRQESSRLEVESSGSGPDPLKVDPARLKIGKETDERVAGFLRGVLKRMAMAALSRGWRLWLRVHKLRSFLHKMMHTNQGLAFLSWRAADVHLRRHQRVRRVMLHCVGRKQALAWRKWVEMSTAIRLREKQHHAMLRWAAWKLAPGWFKWRTVVTTVRGPGRPRLAHCDCVYRLAAGHHCRCSSEKHFGNRLQALRWSIDSALERVTVNTTDRPFNGEPSNGCSQERLAVPFRPWRRQQSRSSVRSVPRSLGPRRIPFRSVPPFRPFHPPFQRRFMARETST